MKVQSEAEKNTEWAQGTERRQMHPEWSKQGDDM